MGGDTLATELAGRVYVVTGSASGIGAATKRALEDRGARVVGADLRDADVMVDLGTEQGRAELVEGVRAAVGDRLDGLVAGAGVAGSTHPPEPVIRINYFGAVATLSGLRPLLAASDAPRAVAISSFAALLERDPEVMDACLAGDEELAVARAQASGVGTDLPTSTAYSSAKSALARWVRRQCVTSDWAGEGITLNAIGPGMIQTPMTAHMIETPEKKAAFLEQVPQPLGMGRPEDVAALLVWLTSPASRYVTGQLIMVDGGLEVCVRGDEVW